MTTSHGGNPTRAQQAVKGRLAVESMEKQFEELEVIPTVEEQQALVVDGRVSPEQVRFEVEHPTQEEKEWAFELRRTLLRGWEVAADGRKKPVRNAMTRLKALQDFLDRCAGPPVRRTERRDTREVRVIVEERPAEVPVKALPVGVTGEIVD